MFVESRTSSLQHLFRGVSKAKRKRRDVGRSGTCTKPNGIALWS
jgi:hypothetical protein